MIVEGIEIETTIEVATDAVHDHQAIEGDANQM